MHDIMKKKNVRQNEKKLFDIVKKEICSTLQKNICSTKFNQNHELVCIWEFIVYFEDMKFKKVI